MKRRALGVVLLTLALACSARSGTLAQFRTPLGNIDVELYDEDKPVTVSNFIRYAQGGFYTNVFLHRCLPGFVAQGYRALKTLVGHPRRRTNRWTRAAGACFVTNLVRRRVL